MAKPAVSVIMPVFNASKYLKKAIDSILLQSFADFEFIIIDDCSTDHSKQIIQSISDNRIRFIAQSENKGVVNAMNEGLNYASAALIAVMHADDIAFKNRLELQMNVLQHHPNTAVIAGKSIFIDEQDKPTGKNWPLDEKTTTPQMIRQQMIKENCISHPTVMMRTDIVKKYGYLSAPSHKGFAVEDYPLWLNILSDGFDIEKLEAPILFYRTHHTSATQTFLRNSNPFMVNYNTKKHYVEYRKKINLYNHFDQQVAQSMQWDLIKGIFKKVKNALSF